MAFSVTTCSSVEGVDRALWNRLAEGASPMMEWEYFHALEKSGSISPEKGYKPSHIVASDRGQPVAIAPMYERDRAWVEFGDGGIVEFLSEITGLPFHRGLVGTIPLTPVPGYQFLVGAGTDPMVANKMLLDQVDALCEERGLSTARIYFVAQTSPHLHRLLQGQGYLTLRSSYSMWFNRGYHSFEDYLEAFKSSRRTKIKREVRSIRDQGISVRMIPGDEAPASLFGDMHRLYVGTWRKHMGLGIRPFLSEGFFRLLAQSFQHRTSFSLATRGDDTLAMAIFYHKAQAMYGRYWGCFQEIPFLHFATCYYHPIDYAIRNGFQMMDPGFGGEHKLIRGYEVVPVHHYLKFYGEKEKRVAITMLQQMQAQQSTAR